MENRTNWWASAAPTDGPSASNANRYVYPMQVTPGRVKGLASRYRTGTLILSSEGVRIDGTAVLPPGIQAIILIPGIVVGLLIVAILLEYALRFAKTDQIAWSAVDEIVLVPGPRRACIVYADPDRKKGDPVSLAFRLTPELYDNFVATANYFLPGRVREGRIGSSTPPSVWWTLLAIVVVIIAAIVYSSSR